VDIKRKLWIPTDALDLLLPLLSDEAKAELAQIIAHNAFPYWMPYHRVEDLLDQIADIVGLLADSIGNSRPSLLKHLKLDPSRAIVLRNTILGYIESGRPLVYDAGPMRLRRVYDAWWRERFGPKVERLPSNPVNLNTVVLECGLYGVEYLDFQAEQRNLVGRGSFRTFGEIFWPVFELDMALIHLLTRHPKSCIVAYFPTDVVKSGTDIECFEAFRLGVATFILQEGPSVDVRPFLQAPWTRMYMEGKFRRFKTWKALLAHLGKWFGGAT